MKQWKEGEFVASLRALADFYEQHPEVPIPYDFTWDIGVAVYLHNNAKDILRVLGSFEKQFSDDHFEAVKMFGGLKLRFSTRREQVCERVVIGKQTVPEKFIPESYTASRTIPEHEEEIVEWRCEPVLAEDKPEEEPATEPVETAAE